MKQKDIYKAYLVVNLVNNKKYVGITTQDLKRRWNAHIALAKRGGTFAISLALNKYGVDQFSFSHIASAINLEDLLALEQVLIQQYTSYGANGYNLTLGGEGALGTGEPIVVAGVKYPSLGFAASAYELSPSFVYTRIHRFNWSVEQAFNIAPPPQREGNEIEIQGAKFSSVSEAARFFDLPVRKVNVRLLNGWSIEEAFDLAPRRDTEKKKSIIVEGKTYQSIAEFAQSYNLPANLVRQRMYAYGWTAEETVGIVKRKCKRNRLGNPKSVVIRGKYYLSIKEAAEEFGFEPATVAARITRYHWTVDQAFGLEPPPDKNRKNGYKVRIGSEEFSSWSKAEAHLGLSKNLVSQRIKKGWSIEEALGLKPRSPTRKGKPIIVAGVKYPSLVDAVRAYGLDREDVRYKLKKGLSIEAAFGL